MPQLKVTLKAECPIHAQSMAKLSRISSIIFRAFRAIRVHQDQGEFPRLRNAPMTSVLRSRCCRKPGENDNDMVTGKVAVCIVYGFETVDIDHDETETSAEAPRAETRKIKLLLGLGWIKEPRQAVFLHEGTDDAHPLPRGWSPINQVFRLDGFGEEIVRPDAVSPQLAILSGLRDRYTMGMLT